jgi:PAS domain S-box-containing protein
MNPNLHESLDATRAAALFKALIQNAFDVIKVIGPDYKTLFTSPAVETILGYSPRELVGSNALNLVHPEDMQVALTALEKVQSGHAIVRVGAIRVLHKSGTWHTIEVVAQNMLDDDDVRGVVLNYRDISERLNVEVELRRTHERCEKAFRSSPDSITITHIDSGAFLDANEGFERITGYQRDEVIGQSSLSLGLWKVPEQRAALVTAVRQEGRTRDFPMDVTVKDGSTRHCLVSAEGIELDGRACLLAVTRDITEIKQADERLRDTTEKLRRDHVELVRKNITLNEVLEHLQQEKEQYRHELCASIENLLRPMIKRIHDSGALPDREIERLQQNIDEVTGRHLDQFKNNVSKLTPRELDIMEMIKAGRSSKQIAEDLGLSSQTVHKHRQSIRRKLQIDHREINLAAYLRSQRTYR